MLLPIRAGLRPSAVFRSLNNLMREVLLASCSGRPIDESTLPCGLLVAAQANPDTNTHLLNLHTAIAALNPMDRYELYLGTREAASVRLLFTDPNSSILDISDTVNIELKKLSIHLFKNSSKLVDIATACGETVKDHYNRYSAKPPLGNGNICGMCATEQLAQKRRNVAASDQWRAPYDHLLAKDKYPQFGIDPDNLLPICHTCNSKAKLAKDLLHNTAGLRRTFFDPWVESAHQKVALKIEFIDIFPTATWKITTTDPINQNKLTTWNDVYQIKDRIEGEFISLREKLSEDLIFDDLEVFKTSIENKAKIRLRSSRLTPYNYWRGLLYSSMLELSDHQLEHLRALCIASLNLDDDIAATYGV